MTNKLQLGAHSSSKQQRFIGKSVLVTGGAGGMGLAATKMFAAEGANVSVLDISHEAGKKMTDDMNDAGYDVFFQQADLSNVLFLLQIQVEDTFVFYLKLNRVPSYLHNLVDVLLGILSNYLMSIFSYSTCDMYLSLIHI